jgi:hypothetical protein
VVFEGTDELYSLGCRGKGIGIRAWGSAPRIYSFGLSGLKL